MSLENNLIKWLSIQDSVLFQIEVQINKIMIYDCLIDWELILFKLSD